MCVILEKKPEHILTPELLRALWARNTDGWGIMYLNDEGTPVRRRGLTVETLIETASILDNRTGYIHTRHATKGLTNRDNCHPYIIMPGFLLMHNGQLDIKCEKELFSDTWHYAEYVLKPLLKSVNDPHAFIRSGAFRFLLQAAVEDNKIVILDKDGAVFYNEDKWCEVRDGMKASNKTMWDADYDKPKTTYTPYISDRKWDVAKQCYVGPDGTEYEHYMGDDDSYGKGWKKAFGKKGNNTVAEAHKILDKWDKEDKKDRGDAECALWEQKSIAKFVTNATQNLEPEHVLYLAEFSSGKKYLVVDKEKHPTVRGYIDHLIDKMVSISPNFKWQSWAENSFSRQYDYELFGKPDETISLTFDQAIGLLSNFGTLDDAAEGILWLIDAQTNDQIEEWADQNPEELFCVLRYLNILQYTPYSLHKMTDEELYEYSILHTAKATTIVIDQIRKTSAYTLMQGVKQEAIEADYSIEGVAHGVM